MLKLWHLISSYVFLSCQLSGGLSPQTLSYGVKYETHNLAGYSNLNSSISHSTAQKPQGNIAAYLERAFMSQNYTRKKTVGYIILEFLSKGQWTYGPTYRLSIDTDIRSKRHPWKSRKYPWNILELSLNFVGRISWQPWLGLHQR